MRLIVTVTTEFSNKEKLKNNVGESDIEKGEQLKSQGIVKSGKWLNINLIKNNHNVSLILNGLLDQKIKLRSEMLERSDITNKLFIGGKMPYEIYIDEFKVYNKVLDMDYIQAEISPMFASTVSNLAEYSLACLDCDLITAEVICKNNSTQQEILEVCPSIKMHLGGYVLARSVGYLRYNTRMWTLESMKYRNVLKNKKGLAMCCLKDY